MCIFEIGVAMPSVYRAIMSAVVLIIVIYIYAEDLFVTILVIVFFFVPFLCVNPVDKIIAYYIDLISAAFIYLGWCKLDAFRLFYRIEDGNAFRTGKIERGGDEMMIFAGIIINICFFV